jgi:hypothetical protein
MAQETNDLDRALGDDDTLVPSSGFAARVMDAVQDAQGEPPPLAFPWRPFAIGLVACLVWAASLISLTNRLDRGLLREVAAAFADAGPLSLYAAAGTVATLIVLGVQRTVLRR